MLISFVIAVAIVVVVPALMLGLVRGLDVPASAVAPGQPPRWLVGWKLWHVIAAVALSALLFAMASAGPHEGPFLAFLLALVVLALFVRAWRYQFLFLMTLRDDDFPGRHDKLIWIIMLTLYAPIGLWLFTSYREAHWPEPQPVKAEPTTANSLM